jgi:hypothetical protein
MPMSLHRHPVSGSFNLPIQGAFQLSITLLLRYRSRDMFSLGGMCPPDSREISDPRYSRSGHIPQVSNTGLSPSMAPRSRGIVLACVGLKGRLTTPHLPAITGGIRFRLSCFHSPLLTASQLVSFPAPTQMFQLRAFPTITGRSREQEFSLGNPGIKGSMRLPRAYRSLARPSSVLEPSHPPDGTATPKTNYFSTSLPNILRR